MLMQAYSGVSNYLCSRFENAQKWYVESSPTKKTIALTVANIVAALPVFGICSAVNCRIENKHIVLLSQAYREQFASLRNFLWDLSPQIHYNGHQLSKLFIAVVLEEALYRELIQCRALPCLAKLLPKPCGDVLNHPITRIFIASVLFAFVHGKHMVESPAGVIPQFVAGLVFGTIVEWDKGIHIAVTSHFIHNLMLGVARRI